MTDSLRLTWVQPEDLIGHELRQAVEDGRDASAVAAVWRAAGGRDAPVRAGASPAPVAPELRSLAVRLLDRLDALPGAQADREPTGLAAIRAACPDWPTRPGDPGGGSAPDRRAHRRPPGAAPGTSPQGRTPHRPGTARGGGGSTSTPRTAGDDGPAPPPGPGGTATDRGGGEPTRYGPEEWVRAGPEEPTRYGPEEWVRAGPKEPMPYGPEEPVPYGPDALHAAWLGRAAGCLLGKPVEKLPLDSIRTIARATGNWPLHTWFTAKGLPDRVARAHPWNRRSAPTSLAENIDGMPEDDDLNYPLLNLLLLQRYGRGFRTADVARLWLDELPPGRTFTAERVAFRNLLTGIEPPLTARHHNPFREWIGAAIRADVHGWTHPGDPGAAAAQAHRDACLTHTANGVYSAMFIAATIAAAARPGADAHRALATGLTVVPPSSRLAHAVRLGIEQARATTDFDTVVDRLHIAYGRYHWVHAVPNAALLAAALTHADGDFTGSICRAVSGGWDTDSNGATAGSVAGLLAGSPDALPERWTSPLKNRLATSVADFDGIGFDALAHLTHQEALRP